MDMLVCILKDLMVFIKGMVWVRGIWKEEC